MKATVLPGNPVKNPEVLFKLIAAVTLWGGSFIATKIALQDISPITLIWLRFGMGVIFLGIAAYRRGQLSLPPARELPFLAFLGFIGITFHQWLQSTGLQTSQANTTAWIVASIPIFTAVLGWLVLREKLSIVQGAGILVAALGVLLVVTGGNLAAVIQGNFGRPGDLLILISAPNWAIFSVLSRRSLRTRPAAWTMFYVMLLGWLFNGVLLVFGQGIGEIANLTRAGWIAVIFLGLLCSGLAYIYYYDALEALPASQVGVFVYLEPLVATVISSVLLDETFGLAALVGGVIILAGVWLVQKKPPDKR